MLMKTSTRFVKELTPEQSQELKDIMKTGAERLRMRAHAILLSDRGYSIDEIADIYEVDRDTVSIWLNRWETGGSTDLDDKPGRGRPATLTEEEEKKVVSLVMEEPRSPKQALPKIEKATGKKISLDILKGVLKKYGKTWKRIRLSLKFRRNEEAFREAQEDLLDLRADAQHLGYDILYFDESGFTLVPCLPYAWQGEGETLELPSVRSERINVAAFYGTDQQFHSFMFKGSITSEIVVACLDNLADVIVRPTLVVHDQASIHTSAIIEGNLEKWNENGLYFYPLPPYSPELNLIEILWRMIKYKWLPLNAYESVQSLWDALAEVLAGVGSKYQINFS